MKQITVDGNEACARMSYYFTEVAGIYPITPSSPMAEHIDEWSQKKATNLFGDVPEVVEMQSEAGAAGMVHGSLQAGCLTSTYTASQGLLLMIPNMYKIAGEMWPFVMHVAARSLSTHALSIFGDHQDIYAARSTGFAYLASSSVQQASDMALVAHLATLKSSIPFLHFFDGFRTSHEIEKITVLEKEEIKQFLDEDALHRFRLRALSSTNPVTRGTAQNDDIYFQQMEAKNPYYRNVPDIVSEMMNGINQKLHTNYQPFEYYGKENATSVIVAMGSVCETIKETIDDLCKQGYEIGLIEVHLYRPFSKEYLEAVLPTSVEKIAVLDRTKEQGSIGEPLYLDVVDALKEKQISIVGGRYGLSSKNTTPRQIKAVYDALEEGLLSPFTIGITDDLTNLSLPLDPTYSIKNGKEIKIYGYGSDGMVSASKTIMKLVGDQTDQYVQGYFQYDSKKSGGVTTSHLRFSEHPIRSTYYVEKPDILVVTKDYYLNEFDLLEELDPGSTVLINTSKTEEELTHFLSKHVKSTIKERKLQVYFLNAYLLAKQSKLQNKISMIMAKVVLHLMHLFDEEKEKLYLKEYIAKTFSKKGEEVVLHNQKAVEDAMQYVFALDTSDYVIVPKEKEELSLLEMIRKRKGNELPTSQFLSHLDGTYTSGVEENQTGISEIVPNWIQDNCIMCNQCSLVCPHGVIRPYLLTEEEYQKAPDLIKRRCKKAVGPNMNGMYFTIAVNIKKCTGCGLCMNTCPGLRQSKALISSPYQEQQKAHQQEIYDYLENHISEKKQENPFTLKTSQFQKPKFAFHGACAGCGETPYIKLLTQLYQDQLVIANATGCSSIYGGSVPEIPYQIPWASSLFEDNAEFSLGMVVANRRMKKKIQTLMEQHHEDHPELYQTWIDHQNDSNITRSVYEKLKEQTPDYLKDFLPYIKKQVYFAIGGDGWAYDIGFGGIDHVLASQEDINILVLDSQVYSNTGGQASKASPEGSIASFASTGKKTAKKDLARIAMQYPHVYVATVSLGANPTQTIRAFEEAVLHPGPSIIIAYSPCISHGLKGGMSRSIESEKQATLCGYFPIFRRNPKTGFTLDSKQVDFEKYQDYLEMQTRYSMLKVVNPEKAEQLLRDNQEAAKERFQYYQSLEEKNPNQ